jgi:toxin CcdB
MAQFDVHKPLKGVDAGAVGLVVLQGDLLEDWRGAIVAPLRSANQAGPLVRGLHVPVKFQNRNCVLHLEEMVAVPRHALGARVGELRQHRDAIIAALDLVFTGY